MSPAWIHGLLTRVTRHPRCQLIRYHDIPSLISSSTSSTLSPLTLLALPALLLPPTAASASSLSLSLSSELKSSSLALPSLSSTLLFVLLSLSSLLIPISLTISAACRKSGHRPPHSRHQDQGQDQRPAITNSTQPTKGWPWTSRNRETAPAIPMTSILIFISLWAIVEKSPVFDPIKLPTRNLKVTFFGFIYLMTVDIKSNK